MRAQILTLCFQPTLGAFDPRAFDDFLADKELLSIRDHFFTAGESAYLVCLITYEAAVDPAMGQHSHRNPGADPPQPSPRASVTVNPDALPLADRTLFATLREWRNERARRDGVPPYVILTNRELLAVVQLRPRTNTDLTAIPGIGAGKTERYGAAILARIERHAAAHASASPTTTTATTLETTPTAEGAA